MAWRHSRELHPDCGTHHRTRPNLGMPYTRAMGDGLFEIRAKGQEGIGRALFCTVVGKRIVILHGFIKKTEQTPQRALDTARRRMKEVRP